jgi:hypothetical protein
MSALWKEKASLESSKTFSARSLTTGEEGECLRCRAVREECDAQLSTLKDKAHQSFMQVLYYLPYSDKYSNFTRKN